MPKKDKVGTADVVKMDAVEVLNNVRGGQPLFEMSQAIEEVVEGVVSTKRAGKVVLTLTIGPLKKGDTSALLVVGEVDAKPPKATPGSSIFFPTEDNRIQREDPRQMRMDGPGFGGPGE